MAILTRKLRATVIEQVGEYWRVTTVSDEGLASELHLASSHFQFAAPIRVGLIIDAVYQVTGHHGTWLAFAEGDSRIAHLAYEN